MMFRPQIRRVSPVQRRMVDLATCEGSGRISVLVVHYRCVQADDVGSVTTGECARYGVETLASASLLPELVLVDAPGWRCVPVLAHRSWAPQVRAQAMHPSADGPRPGAHRFATSTSTEVGVVLNWCSSRAVDRLLSNGVAEVAGAGQIQLDGGLLLAVAVGLECSANIDRRRLVAS